MKKIFILILFFTIYLTNLNPAYSISPDVFIQSTVNRASQVLSENISKDEKINKELSVLLENNIKNKQLIILLENNIKKTRKKIIQLN